MGAHSASRVRAFARAAKLHGDTVGKTATQVLSELLAKQFTSHFSNGRTVISTSDGGGSTSFAFPEAMTPLDIVDLADSALNWLAAQPDPDNPTFTARPIRRLRVRFDNATL